MQPDASQAKTQDLIERLSDRIAEKLSDKFVSRFECDEKHRQTGLVWKLLLGSYAFTASAAAFVLGLLWSKI